VPVYPYDVSLKLLCFDGLILPDRIHIIRGK